MDNPYAPPPAGGRAARPAGPGDTPGDGTGESADDARRGTPGAGPHGPAGPQGGPGGSGGQGGSGGSGGPHGPAGPQPPRRPEPPAPPPDPEAVRRASRQVMHFGLLMLATLVAATLSLPWQAAALAFAIAAMVAGVIALRSVWRAGLRGALLPVLGMGLAFAALMSLSLVTMLALWPVQMERQECLRDALTISASEACEAQYQDALQERLDRATGSPTDG